jgi:hypothetical protein
MAEVLHKPGKRGNGKSRLDAKLVELSGCYIFSAIWRATISKSARAGA